MSPLLNKRIRTRMRIWKRGKRSQRRNTISSEKERRQDEKEEGGYEIS